jgi:hypothetical protein
MAHNSIADQTSDNKNLTRELAILASVLVTLFFGRTAIWFEDFFYMHQDIQRLFTITCSLRDGDSVSHDAKA